MIKLKNSLMDRIKKAMADREMSAAELSRLTGISPSSLSEYLNGRYEPKQDKVALISNALKVSPGWLLGFDANTSSTTSTNNNAPSMQDAHASLPDLTQKDEREIESDLEDMMNSISSAAYDGDDGIEDMEAFKATIKAAMIQAKKIAKKKYTPKKYRKDK